MKKDESISVSQQLIGLGVGLVLSIMIAFSVFALFQQAPVEGSEESTSLLFTSQVIVWASLGGFLGGAGRTLYRLILEWGGHIKGKDPSYYFDKWYLYLVKPFVGVVGGIAFVLAVNLGLVRVYTSEPPQFNFPLVLLTSVIGGLWFEDVFSLLRQGIKSGNGTDPKDNHSDDSSTKEE